MTHVHPMAGIPAEVFQQRRAAVAAALGRGVMVLPAAPQLHRSRDTEVAYRPDSELFYLTGCTEPGAVAVVIGGDDPRFVLFVQERDPEAERWSGPRHGPEEAAERFGADETRGLGELDLHLRKLLQESERIHFRLGRGGVLDPMVLGALAFSRTRGARKGIGPRALIDPGEILDELRLIKDEHEIARLRASAALSTEGHRAAIAMARPGVGEWAVEAEVDAVFRRGGGTGPGFDTIVGSGANACVLHHVANDRVIEEGDLVLVDAGAELGLYQGDVTRTFPAGGRFSPEQRAVYDVVERARTEAVAAAGPGQAIGAVHDTVVRVLTEGMLELGVLEGRTEDLIAEEAYRDYFPHQTSHWLGIDVHDPGDYAREGRSRVLEAGMVFTVEPGLYFPAGAGEGATRFEGIGVRIEDDLLVTPDGVENLTAPSLPTGAEEVEALVLGAR